MTESLDDCVEVVVSSFFSVPFEIACPVRCSETFRFLDFEDDDVADADWVIAVVIDLASFEVLSGCFFVPRECCSMRLVAAWSILNDGPGPFPSVSDLIF
jgi:hypothetical protein